MTIELPKKIYLFDYDDDVVWCKDPDPEDHGGADAIGYIREDVAKQQNEALLAQVAILEAVLLTEVLPILRENNWRGDLQEAIEYKIAEPQQSLDSLKARIENETIDRCIKTIIDEPEYISSSHSTRHGYVRAVNDMRKSLEAMPRKYQPSTKADKGEME